MVYDTHNDPTVWMKWETLGRARRSSFSEGLLHLHRRNPTKFHLQEGATNVKQLRRGQVKPGGGFFQVVRAFHYYERDIAGLDGNC